MLTDRLYWKRKQLAQKVDIVNPKDDDGFGVTLGSINGNIVSLKQGHMLAIANEADFPSWLVFGQQMQQAMRSGKSIVALDNEDNPSLLRHTYSQLINAGYNIYVVNLGGSYVICDAVNVIKQRYGLETEVQTFGFTDKICEPQSKFSDSEDGVKLVVEALAMYVLYSKDIEDRNRTIETIINIMSRMDAESVDGFLQTLSVMDRQSLDCWMQTNKFPEDRLERFMAHLSAHFNRVVKQERDSDSAQFSFDVLSQRKTAIFIEIAREDHDRFSGDYKRNMSIASVMGFLLRGIMSGIKNCSLPEYSEHGAVVYWQISQALRGTIDLDRRLSEPLLCRKNISYVVRTNSIQEAERYARSLTGLLDACNAISFHGKRGLLQSGIATGRMKKKVEKDFNPYHIYSYMDEVKEPLITESLWMP